LEKLDFEVEQDSVGNVLARINRGNPKVLLCGHIDTVPNFIPVKFKNDLLYGRGAVDAKGPFAAMIIAAHQLAIEGYEGSILLVGAVDEEGKGRGVKNLIKQQIDVDYAIFGEPTNVDTITVGYRGNIVLKIKTETETGHSSAPWLFDNAVEKAMEFWNLMKNLEMPQEKKESKFHSLSSSLEAIKGGDKGSTIPHTCEMRISIRIPPSIKVEQVLDQVKKIIEKYKSNNPGVKTNGDTEDLTEAYIAPTKSIIVRTLSQAIWKVRRKQVKLVYKTGTGDMNNYGNVKNIPIVTYGPGDPHLDHTPNEHIKLKDYFESIEVIKETLRKLI
jgi:LysW-gamma-L-lysine carboxypeptidase